MKKFILVIIVYLLFPRGIIASTINYSLRIKVDDAYFVPKEEDGSDIRPITHEGTTYLPMRALVTALGAKISSNQGVIYIESGERVPMQSEKTKCYSKIEKIDTVIKEDTLLYVNEEQIHCRTLFYKNRMYLPVRTLSQVLGERIEYNSDRHILLIGNAELTAEDYFMTEEDVKEKLKSLRSKYPHNKYWNTVGITVPEGIDTSEYVTNQPCTHYFDYYFGYM